jgi:D-glycero-alpha-D-manno-heptose-7-phosphate kinase
MIFSRTPYRVSFFGGGTDYPAWSREEGGAVLSTTIDKYCYISCRILPPFFNIKHRIVWSHIETVNSVSEILHPAVREGLRFLEFDNAVGLEIHHQGDLPARSGIGSSSSFSVGLIKALLALKGISIGKHDLAIKAIEFEQRVLREHVGSQDQVAASYGGFNLIRFEKDGTIQVAPIDIPRPRRTQLESRLLLFYTGSSRMGSEVAEEIIGGARKKEHELRSLRKMVDVAHELVRGDHDLDDFGRLLHEAWMHKRELSPRVSSPLVDQIYKAAVAAGALGGKLLGAGSTGFMMFYVPPERQPGVRAALSTYLTVPFQFESEGCSIIYQDRPATAP